jgi:hypothetical protein
VNGFGGMHTTKMAWVKVLMCQRVRFVNAYEMQEIKYETQTTKETLYDVR